MSQPGLVVETTVLQGAYMFWVGPCASEEEKDGAVEAGRLGRDWACAMPPLAVGELTAAYIAAKLAAEWGKQWHCVIQECSARCGVIDGNTTWWVASSSSASTLLTWRPARRLHSQVFVGLDVPDGEMLMLAEKKIVASLALL